MKTWVNIHIDLNISTLETQIHSLPQGISLGANIAASPVKDVHKAGTALVYAALSGIIGKMKWKCQRHVSEDRRVLSETHSHKNICPAILLWNVQHSHLMTSLPFEV